MGKIKFVARMDIREENPEINVSNGGGNTTHIIFDDGHDQIMIAMTHIQADILIERFVQVRQSRRY
jgi:hypothetical protein